MGNDGPVAMGIINEDNADGTFRLFEGGPVIFDSIDPETGLPEAEPWTGSGEYAVAIMTGMDGTADTYLYMNIQFDSEQLITSFTDFCDETLAVLTDDDYEGEFTEENAEETLAILKAALAAFENPDAEGSTEAIAEFSQVFVMGITPGNNPYFTSKGTAELSWADFYSTEDLEYGEKLMQKVISFATEDLIQELLDIVTDKLGELLED